MLLSLLFQILVRSGFQDTTVVPQTGKLISTQKPISHTKIPLLQTLGTIPPNSIELIGRLEEIIIEHEDVQWKVSIIKNLGRGTGTTSYFGIGEQVMIHYKGNQPSPPKNENIRIRVEETRFADNSQKVELDTYRYSIEDK
jgi:hypothetical protein